MAGPKAPIGSLKEHAAQSALLARKERDAFSRQRRATAKKQQVNAGLEDSESDSGSESGSDSDSSAGADNGDYLQQQLASKSSAPKNKASQDMSAPLKAQASTKVPTTKSEAPSSDAESESESDSSSDSGSGSDSDTESESASESEGNPASKRPNKPATSQRKAGTNGRGKSEPGSEEVAQLKSARTPPSAGESATSESDSESESDSGNKAPGAASAGSGDEPSSSEDGSSSSGDESGSGSDEEAHETMALDARKDDVADSRVPEIIGQDFHLRKAGEDVDASDVAQILSQAKMEGKQVWYFTAPSTIPIEVVEKLEIPLERAQNGRSILTHGGADYGVAFEDASTTRSIKLLIPNKAGDRYGMLNRPVDQTMHLKRITQFSNGPDNTTVLAQSHTTTTTTTAAATTRPARPQPRGLRARFQPIGVTQGPMGSIGVDESPEGDEDVDMAPASPHTSSQKNTASAKAVETPKADRKKKRKHPAGEEASTSQLPDGTGSSKKTKKARVDQKDGKATPQPRKVAANPVAAGANGVAKPTTTPRAGKETPVPLPPSALRVMQSMAPPSAGSQSPSVRSDKGRRARAQGR